MSNAISSSSTTMTVRAAEITAHALHAAETTVRQSIILACAAGATPAEVEPAGRIAEALAGSAAAADAAILPLMQARAAARMQALLAMPETAPEAPEAPEAELEAPEAPEAMPSWPDLSAALQDAEAAERDARRHLDALHDADADDPDLADAEYSLYMAQLATDAARTAWERREPEFSRPGV